MAKQTAPPPDPQIQADIVAAQAGDQEALDRIWIAAWETARRVALSYCKKYEWLDADELRQELLLGLPRFIKRYDASDPSKTDWPKYLFFRMNFFAKDILRREDPLGISWPQKREYPSWNRLGDASLSGFDAIDNRESEIDIIDREEDDQLPELRSLLVDIAPQMFGVGGKIFMNEYRKKRLEKNGKPVKRKRPKRPHRPEKVKAKNQNSSFKTYMRSQRYESQKESTEEMNNSIVGGHPATDNQYHQPPAEPTGNIVPPMQTPVQPVVAPAVVPPPLAAPEPQATPEAMPEAIPEPQAAPQPEAEPTPAAEKKDGWAPAKRERWLAAKAAGTAAPATPKRKPPARKTPAKKTTSSPQKPVSAAVSATSLLSLAAAFVDAAGGTRNARELLEQIEAMKR